MPCDAISLVSLLPHCSWQSRCPTHFQLTKLVVSTFNHIIILIGNYYTPDSLSPNLNSSFFPHILFIPVISNHSEFATHENLLLIPPQGLCMCFFFFWKHSSNISYVADSFFSFKCYFLRVVFPKTLSHLAPAPLLSISLPYLIFF